MMETDIRDLLIILDESPIGVSVSRRRDGTIVYVNHRFAELVGLPKVRLIGTRASASYVDDQQRHLVIDQLKNRGRVDDLDIRFRQSGGAAFWAVLTVRSTILNGEGVNLAWIYDIDERKRHERFLQDSQSLLQTMLDASSDAVALFFPDGQLLSVNAEMAGRLAISSDRLIGANLWSLLPLELALSLREATARVIAGGRQVHNFEHRGERFLDNRIYPVSNGDGAIEKIALFSRDITILKKRDAELRKLSMAVEQAPVTVVITDTKGDIEYVNKAFSDVSGYRPEEVIGRNPRLLKSERVPDSTFSDLWKTISTGRVWQGELCNKKKDGSVFWEAVTIAPVKNEDDTITSYLAVKENITLRKDYETKLLHQATHDALTGLPNRLLLQDRLGHGIEIARREHSRVAVMFIDLDRFKVVNDSLGHEAGDRLLVAIANRLQVCLRRSDTIARLGGDEFVVVLSNFQTVGEIVEVAEKIIARIDEPLLLGDYKVHVGASIGIAFFPDDGGDVTALMRGADSAMYRAKSGGRNTFRFVDAAMNGEAIERLNLEASLRRALEAHEFELYYQPKLSLETREILGVEALIRWNSPDRGLVSPLVFIPLAEETGLITQIGDWVLNEACRQLALWRGRGKNLLSVAVNISARQFLDPGLAEKIARLLLQHNLPPAAFEIELTESTVMADPEIAIGQLVRLRDIGLQVSVDDFGTGYSSLSYLKRLPVSTIKVDRSFVHCVDQQADNAAIVAAILGLGDALGMSIVAEGVETDGEEDHLRTAGCATVQGFKYAKPLPAAELEQWMDAFDDPTPFQVHGSA